MKNLIVRVMTIIFTGGTFLQKVNYTIVEIKDEEVPLAPGRGSPYFYPMLFTMILLILLLSVMIYGILCYRYRKRIGELDAEIDMHSEWRLWKLRETVRELEEAKAESAMQEIQKEFERNSKNAEPFYGNA